MLSAVFFAACSPKSVPQVEETVIAQKQEPSSDKVFTKELLLGEWYVTRVKDTANWVALNDKKYHIIFKDDNAMIRETPESKTTYEYAINKNILTIYGINKLVYQTITYMDKEENVLQLFVQEGDFSYMIEITKQ